MKKTINLITSNPRKVESLNSVVKPYGYSVKTLNIQCPEIQSDSTAEVAGFSAEWVSNKYNKTCIKMDSGFYVNPLDGFPGTYVRWVDQKLGVDKFIKMLNLSEENLCTIFSSLAYCVPGNKPVVFVGNCKGRIANKVGKYGSFIDRLFVPNHNNFNQYTLGELRLKHPEVINSIWGQAENKFVKWLLKNELR